MMDRKRLVARGDVLNSEPAAGARNARADPGSEPWLVHCSGRCTLMNRCRSSIPRPNLETRLEDSSEKLWCLSWTRAAQDTDEPPVGRHLQTLVASITQRSALLYSTSMGETRSDNRLLKQV